MLGHVLLIISVYYWFARDIAIIFLRPNSIAAMDTHRKFHRDQNLGVHVSMHTLSRFKNLCRSNARGTETKIDCRDDSIFSKFSSGKLLETELDTFFYKFCWSESSEFKFSDLNWNAVGKHRKRCCETYLLFAQLRLWRIFSFLQAISNWFFVYSWYG